MRFPGFLSMCVGFLSLSQEILWMRWQGFATQGLPQVFSVVLMIYLLGIAAGALMGRIACARTSTLYTVSGKVLIVAAILDMIGPIAAAIHVLRFLVLPLIFLCAALKSVIFPIAHHLGSSQEKGSVGKSISRIYFLNIIGSASGPLVTGFWLVDIVSLQTAMLIMGMLTALLGLLCLARENKLAAVAKFALMPLALLLLFLLPEQTVHRMVCHPDNNASLATRRVLETRSGIIHTIFSKDGKGGDYTFGGNVYDGRDNIDPRVNSNILQRVYLMAALRPEPKRILVIGLSSGAWVRILAGFPGVKDIEVVEINPGYLQLIRQDYPDIAPILSDPHVHINIDDGRRWLKRHPDDRFDLIVMNTTFYWRNYSTNLLSREFLGMARKHLAPGGVITYNSTGSPDPLKTAEAVFPYAFGYINFVVAGEQDFRPRAKTGEKQLLRIRHDGKLTFDPANPQDQAFIRQTLFGIPFESSADERPNLNRDPEVITDWNMITEYKYGLPLQRICP